MSPVSDDTPPVPPASADRGDISLDWLIRLRWGAAAGQLLTIGAAQALFGGLPVARLLALVAASFASNAVLALGRRRLADPRSLCGGALALDTVLLTALLDASGGAYNPFSVLYLVYIALAAVVLRARWTWFLAGLSVVCYGLLFAAGASQGHDTHRGDDLGAHLQGMWVAFTVAAVLTAYFVVKLSTALERREEVDGRDAGARCAPRAAGGGDDARGGRGPRARHAARHDRCRQPASSSGRFARFRSRRAAR